MPGAACGGPIPRRPQVPSPGTTRAPDLSPLSKARGCSVPGNAPVFELGVRDFKCKQQSYSLLHHSLSPADPYAHAWAYLRKGGLPHDIWQVGFAALPSNMHLRLLPSHSCTCPAGQHLSQQPAHPCTAGPPWLPAALQSHGPCCQPPGPAPPAALTPHGGASTSAVGNLTRPPFACHSDPQPCLALLHWGEAGTDPNVHPGGSHVLRCVSHKPSAKKASLHLSPGHSRTFSLRLSL